MKVLDSVLKRENNNFDLVRLLAALMVVLFHTFYIFKSDQPQTHTIALMQGESLGGIAVYIFFFLSGMFITSSFVSLKSNYAFIIMRIFRIWPALIVCVVFAVFIAGPLVSTHSIKEYFALRGTWDYLIHNVLLYHIRYTLPGVFDSNYYPSAVNGSIWTLPIEIVCYFMIWLFGIAGVFKNKIASVLVYSLIIALYILNFRSIKDFLNTPFPFFVAGSLLYIFRKNILIDYRIAIVLLIIYGIFFKVFLLYIALMYSVLVLGSSGIFKRIKLPGDYSYGIYIYAFLVQQLVAYYDPAISPYKSLFLTVPFTVLLASLSWHFIERPSIQLGRKITRRIRQAEPVEPLLEKE